MLLVITAHRNLPRAPRRHLREGRLPGDGRTGRRSIRGAEQSVRTLHRLQGRLVPLRQAIARAFDEMLPVTDGNRFRSTIENFRGASTFRERTACASTGRSSECRRDVAKMQTRAVRLPTSCSSGVMLHEEYSFAVGKRQRTSLRNCGSDPYPPSPATGRPCSLLDRQRHGNAARPGCVFDRACATLPTTAAAAAPTVDRQQRGMYGDRSVPARGNLRSRAGHPAPVTRAA